MDSSGISFTHDMGLANHFSRPGYSAYERTGLHGCFSYMTHEELTNWLMCGLVYENQTRDHRRLKRTLPVFCAALESLLQRDHPDPAQRDGVMSLDVPDARAAVRSPRTTVSMSRWVRPVIIFIWP